MKLLTQFAIILGLSAATALAQPGPGGPNGFGGPPGRGQRQAPPLMRALDSNTNGVLEATEIASAPKSLATLDADSDGKLSATELMPLPPGMTSAQRPALPAGVKLPSSPVQKALDANADGELDATEISNAATTLLKLDANSDGQLSQEEMRPSRPEGGRGPGGGKQSPPQ